MRLYRLGDSGTPVRDIQARLGALGFSCKPDPAGEFREATRDAVVAFQNQRGLPPDGIIGPETWRSLYEAGYRLGDRLLYTRRPMLRGDDVAELQRRLNSLGFDADKVDGIFGPLTLRAVLEFQQNRGLTEDGIAGPAFIRELSLVARATRKTGRDAVREREWLRRLPTTIAATRVVLDPACGSEEEAVATWAAATAAASALQRFGAIPLLTRSAASHPPERIRARRANRLGAEVILGFRQASQVDESVSFFASSKSHSEAGAFIAAELASALDLTVAGRAQPLLKETRAPAVIICHTRVDPALGRHVAQSLVAFFEHADHLR